MKAVCQYCKRDAELVSSKVVYRGNDYGKIWLCSPCGAWVGVHRGTDAPLGSLANAELREWRKKAHAAFDPAWRNATERGQRKGSARRRAYLWLATQLGIPVDDCHIGQFDIDACKQVIGVCAQGVGQMNLSASALSDRLAFQPACTPCAGAVGTGDF